MPLAGAGATRGQAPEQPRPGVTTTSATNTDGSLPPAPGQVAVRIRASRQRQPILDDELREAMVMRAGEMARMPETQRVAFAQELASKELDRLIERELILQDACQAEGTEEAANYRRTQRDASKEAIDGSLTSRKTPSTPTTPSFAPSWPKRACRLTAFGGRPSETSWSPSTSAI